MNDIQNYVIDLGAARNQQVDESFLRMFGGAVQAILGRMFGGTNTPVSIRGTRSEVESFSRAIDKEYKYMRAFKQHGLDDPRTFKSKSKLQSAISNFERTTGLSWPFK